MRILVAPDKFKDSLGADAVAQEIAAGLRSVLPTAELVLLPVADGGEGTAAAIGAAAGGHWHSCAVHDALGAPVSARYLTIDGGATAVLETSEANGLWRIAPEQRDLRRANSFGVGEMLLAATAAGVVRIIAGLGGSATNDGGFGMARALGFRFRGENGAELTGDVSDLLRLARIEKPRALQLPKITAAADVRNPLLGERGATRIFAAQKGASDEEIEILERALEKLSEVVRRDFGGRDFYDQPGAGAAGGLGFALMTFCGAEMRAGFEVVAEAIDLEAKIGAADIVITGEGRLDAQTAAGKAPAGVARMARAAGKPVFAIVGSAAAAERAMFDRVLVLAEPPVTEAEAIARAPALLRERARELARSLA